MGRKGLILRLEEGSFRRCLVADFLIERIGKALQNQSVPGGGYYQLTAEAFALFDQNPLRFLGHVITLEYQERQLPTFLSTGYVEVKVLNTVFRY